MCSTKPRTPLTTTGVVVLRRFGISPEETSLLELMVKSDREEWISWKIAEASLIRNHASDIDDLIVELLIHETAHPLAVRRSVAVKFLRGAVSEYIRETDPEQVPYNLAPL